MLRLPGRALRSSKPLLSASLPHNTRPQSVFLQSIRALATTSTGKEQSVRHQHAVSNPTLANIEKRWEQMPPQEQAELWMALRDRMTVDWHQLTMQEKKASYWIAFGPHGPRSQPDPNITWKVLKTVTYCLIGSAVLFSISRHFAGPAPRTMTKEYQELSNEYLRSQRAEPITGLSSEGYKGKGMVQSKPAGKKPDAEEEEED